MSPPRTRTAAALAFALLAGWWVWTVRLVLHAPPATRDALMWIRRGTGEGWVEWTLLSQHFIGYRPLTALSFTLSDALCGPSALCFRAADVGLYVAAVALLAVLAARWLGALPALVAAALCFAHPASEEIVFDLARRSYTLAAVGSLLGLLLLERRPVAAGVAFLAAIACNEVAIIPALVAPAISAWRCPERGWRGGWPPVAAVAVMAVLRVVILRGQGSYRSMEIVLPWLADGPMFSKEPIVAAPLLAGGAGIYQALLPVAGDGARSLLGTGPGLLLGIPAALLLGRGLWRAGLGGRGLLAWFLGLNLLAAVTVTWFWRMAWPSLLPLGLAAALVAARGDRLTRGAALLLTANLAAQSPLLRGHRRVFDALASRGDLIADFEAALQTIPPQTRAYLVVPYTDHWARSSVRWMKYRDPDRSIRLAAYRGSRERLRLAESSDGGLYLHEDAALTEDAAAFLAAGTTLTADALPEDAVLLWREDGTIRRLGSE